jgi:hypothetical protein
MQEKSHQIASRFIENLKYFETLLRYQNIIHEEIKSRLNSGILIFPLVQNPLSPPLLSRNV